MLDLILEETKEKMEKSIEAFKHELSSVRTGRANPTMLDRVKVNYWGEMTPLNQTAGISVVEGRQLVVKPYDKNILKDIEHAIYEANLGLTPQNDGEAIRIIIPQLTEDRRKELVKDVKAELEKAKVAVRNVRREAMDDLKKGNKDGDFNDDEFHDLEDKVQKETDAGIKNLENIAQDKEDELMGK